MSSIIYPLQQRAKKEKEEKLAREIREIEACQREMKRQVRVGEGRDWTCLDHATKAHAFNLTASNDVTGGKCSFEEEGREGTSIQDPYRE